jgi:hypothetical protein
MAAEISLGSSAWEQAPCANPASSGVGGQSGRNPERGQDNRLLANLNYLVAHQLGQRNDLRIRAGVTDGSSTAGAALTGAVHKQPQSPCASNISLRWSGGG